MNSDLKNCDQPADKLGKLLRGRNAVSALLGRAPPLPRGSDAYEGGVFRVVGSATFEFQKSKMANARNYAFSGTQKIGGWPPGKHLRQFLIQGGFFRGLEQYVLSRKQLEIETRLL